MMPRLRILMLVAGAILVAGASACGGLFEGATDWAHGDQPLLLSGGSYRVVGGVGYLPADEASVLAVTAQLDRANATLVLTRSDGSRVTLHVVPRPRAQWGSGCLGARNLFEVVDLSPGPLQVESLTISTPAAIASCNAGGMIIANDASGGGAYLVLSLQAPP